MKNFFHWLCKMKKIFSFYFFKTLNLSIKRGYNLKNKVKDIINEKEFDKNKKKDIIKKTYIDKKKLVPLKILNNTDKILLLYNIPAGCNRFDIGNFLNEKLKTNFSLN